MCNVYHWVGILGTSSGFSGLEFSTAHSGHSIQPMLPQPLSYPTQPTMQREPSAPLGSTPAQACCCNPSFPTKADAMLH